MLQTLGNESYYIFMILNKKGDMWFNIYDLKENAVYEKKDIEILIEDENLDLWLKEQNSMFSKPATVTPSWARENFATQERTAIHTTTRQTQGMIDYHDYLTKDSAVGDPFYTTEDPNDVNGILLAAQNKGSVGGSTVADKYKAKYNTKPTTKPKGGTKK